MTLDWLHWTLIVGVSVMTLLFIVTGFQYGDYMIESQKQVEHLEMELKYIRTDNLALMMTLQKIEQVPEIGEAQMMSMKLNSGRWRELMEMVEEVTAKE